MEYTRTGVILRASGINLWGSDINAEDSARSTASRGTPENKLILRDISFEVRDIHRPGVEQGQVVGLVGKSGIGKTQLFRIIAGMQRPSSGTLQIGEGLHPVRAGEVGIVPQTYTLFRHRTVRGNLSLSLRQSGRKMTAAEVRAQIDAQAADFNLTEHLGKYPAQLSGGQMQRVSILQQLMAGNKTVLMDEPFSGLDVLMIDKVLALIQKVSLLDELNTLVIVSHDLENVLAIADTAFVMAVQKGVDPQGVAVDVPGATVVKEIDLAGMGLAFDPGIRDAPGFREVLRDVKASL
jgi:ABC-type nitrate/sulfonate/bicarbonate transport system ATPase subunit